MPRISTEVSQNINGMHGYQRDAHSSTARSSATQISVERPPLWHRFSLNKKWRAEIRCSPVFLLFFFSPSFPSMISLAFMLFSVAVVNGLSTISRRDIRCYSSDSIGSELTNSSVDPMSQSVSCTYLGGEGTCTYFSDGRFNSGSSNCPPWLSGSTASNLHCYSFNFKAIQEGYGSPLSRVNYNANVSDTLLECIYKDGMYCVYYLTNGLAIPQMSYPYCPPNLIPHFNNFTCVPTDVPGSRLVGSVAINQTDLACTYGDSYNQCIYSAGILNSGSSDCPPRTSVASQSTVCLPVDNAGFKLLSASSTSSTGIRTCNYQNSNVCTYSTSDGRIASGSSACPPSIASSGGPVGWDPVGPVKGIAHGESALLATDANSDDGDDHKNNSLSPTMIALLAVNGFLVIALLVIASVWLFGRPSSSVNLRPLSARTSYKTVESVSVPLTHGGNDEIY
ncbi:hypothetical protein C8J57DRAFT_1304990 [Mycena rebaudengoi]|nr:hypothetical protein C8J57DRAFT_1304990 [Mycena rebaudengoi]